MKILLTVPMDRPTGRALSPAEDYPYVNDNGLGYIAASSKKAGADVTMYSWNINFDMETYRKKLLELNPDMVGIKVFTTHFARVYKTLSVIRETLPDAFIIIGGPHPSTSKPIDLFNEFDDIIDFAIAGDGEIGISNLINLIKTTGKKLKSDHLTDVPGLIYKDGNEVKFNKPSFEIDLDKLPQKDWSIQQPNWFRSPIVFLDDSRGCPARCGHCNSYMINGGRPRHRSLKVLCAEIEELVYEYNVSTLAFTGNVFMSDTDYVKDLCNWLLELNKPIKWICTGSAYSEKFLDQKLLNLMKRAGCFQIQFGIESGNPGIRKKLSYPIPLHTYYKIISQTVKAGIHAHGSFMFGLPDETSQQINETIDFSISTPFSSRVYCICLPLPGTSSYHAVLEQNGIDHIDWKTYDFSNPKMLPCRVSLNELKIKLLLARGLERSKLACKIYKQLFMK